MKQALLSIIGLMFLASCSSNSDENADKTFNYKTFVEPKHYICQKVDGIKIDGSINDWASIAWTEYFNDIEGEDKAKPRFKTRAKMAWDNNYLYIMAKLEEPHVWAKITERDEVIFYDNDFEVFIDPDGDTHHYYELEVNAFETAWDLLLTRPYRDYGHVIDSWDILGLQVKVSVEGSINDPSDIDEGWVVEMALPFEVLQECSGKDRAPKNGEYWRINFSRVEWKTEVRDGVYEKQLNPENGKPLPEDNWVWSPQYHINMHMPEYWGFIVFSEDSESIKDDWKMPHNELIKWHLRNVYYQQKNFQKEFSKFAESALELGWGSSDNIINTEIPEVLLTNSGFQATLPAVEAGKFWLIDETGIIHMK